VIAFARERIAHFKAPRRVELVEELPRNATGKLLKRVLRERFAGSAAAVSR
jgi:fatty-acyl-CoA synthase